MKKELDSPSESQPRKSFILYTEYAEHLEKLSMEERGLLITAVFNHVREEKLPDMGGAVEMAFSFIRSALDRNDKKYRETVEKRRAAGRKGGLARAAKQEQTNQANAVFAKQTQANQADNVRENVIVNENVNDRVNVINTGASSFSGAGRSAWSSRRKAINAEINKASHTDYNALVDKELLEAMNEN